MATKTMREPLNRDRVLAAALALADTEGIQTLTMRRLAGHLGIEAMSLYYHLPGKDALLDGLTDTVVDETETAGTGTDGPHWRTSLRQRFLTARRLMLRHPWPRPC
jgi:AcrR family transcriptional regulator